MNNGRQALVHDERRCVVRAGRGNEVLNGLSEIRLPSQSAKSFNIRESKK